MTSTRFVATALLILAALFLTWEIVGAGLWVRDAGGLGPAFVHLGRALGSDWMALIIVTDHVLIAGIVLVGLWIDAAWCGWSLTRRAVLAAAFVALGSPTLLAYLAWRLGRGQHEQGR